MHHLPAPTPERESTTTASALVRRFGVWQERALKAPVYVLHRGRPRLILASVEMIELLCRPHDKEGDSRRLAALLDGSPEMILVVDRALAIVTASRSVRARFGERAAAGAPFPALLDAADTDIVARAIGRVAATALAETIEVAFAGEADRHLSLAIEPHPDGVALFGRHIVQEEANDDASLDETFAVSRGAAVARIDRNGFLDGSHAALAALTGIGPAMLSSLRFVSLVALPTRAAVAQTIAAVEADGTPRSVAARLLVDHGEPRGVTISFAPRRRAARIDGVVALILATN